MTSSKEKIVNKINTFDEKKLKMIENYIKRIERVTSLDTKPNREDIDKTTVKYKLLLEYVNGILKNLDKTEIDDLTKFENIDRLDIITDKNTDLLNRMAPVIFKYFDKNKCGYYRRTKNIALNCLRGMCKEIGLKLINKKRDAMENVNGRRYKYTHYYYTII